MSYVIEEEDTWRETNFVIHNLPERNNEDEDATDVMEIMEEIMQTDYTHELEEDAFTKKPKIYRMGRKEDAATHDPPLCWPSESA